MSGKTRLTDTEKKLIRRYLVWCYKTTKEDLDRIDRYFTQLKVDARLLQQLLKNVPRKDVPDRNFYLNKVNEFKEYMTNKEKSAYPKKFADQKGKVLQPTYWYLKNRLSAVERAVVSFLGVRQLKVIRDLYEQEMMRRILEAREHT